VCRHVSEDVPNPGPSGQQLRGAGCVMAAQPTKGGFGLYRVSHHAYLPSVLPIGGVPRGSPEDALDTAFGGCLGDPTAWIRPPKN
jgi:hypothetical protein